jgi:lysyl-tRNA synthetase class 2
MELNELEKIRLQKIERMRSAGMEPFPTRASVTHTTAAAIKAFEAAEPKKQAVEATVAGRLRALRPMGKIAFAHIEDSSGRLQLFFRLNELGQEGMQQLVDLFDLGDFIQASGTMVRTRTGEVTLQVKSFQMLAKALSPLPAAKDEVVDGEVVRHATLADPETRFRQRYADLAVNADIREVFRIRARVVSALRAFLDERGFLEVETPILQPIYGGALARPFVTHHNQLHQDLYLRISFELYLKRLLVGGLERVYEIGRDFRNEGVSFKHNPEFTQLEFYQAYSDYQQIMQLTEEMIAFVADKVLGQRKVTYEGVEIDLNPPWKRISMRQALIDAVGIDILEHKNAKSLEKAMQAKGLKFKPGSPRGKLIEGMLGDFIEPKQVQPTFIYDYPRDISPLAKNKPDDPDTVERFEGYMGGMEICNAFTELNEALEQEKRFQEMGRTFAEDDEDHHPMDEDYLRALAYGMPPAGGFGMGIDRLAMIMSGRKSIREVILFPHLREKGESE